jgi:hypothetical protein
MSYRTCDYLKEDSVDCDSAALRRRNFCHFHLNVRRRRLSQSASLAAIPAAFGDPQTTPTCTASTTQVAREPQIWCCNSNWLNNLPVTLFGMKTLRAKHTLNR